MEQKPRHSELDQMFAPLFIQLDPAVAEKLKADREAEEAASKRRHKEHLRTARDLAAKAKAFREKMYPKHMW